jgi:hypothetical protein
MSLPRKIKVVLITFAALITFVVLAIWISWSQIKTRLTTTHQQIVTKELAQWGQEYGIVTNLPQAVACAEMVDYMRHYYVPTDGYRGRPEVEAALEQQRAASIEQIVTALEKFTSLHFGTNTEQWRCWADEKKQAMATPKNGEPSGAADGRRQFSPLQFRLDSFPLRHTHHLTQQRIQGH